MKKTYHSDIFVQFKLGILDTKVLKQIPRSTLHNWKSKDVHQLFGLDSVHDFDENKEFLATFMKNRNLLQIVKSMYSIFSTYNTILGSIKNKNKVLRNSKEAIIKTIDNIKEAFGFSEAIEAFGISYQQFYAWKKHIICKQNCKILCRKLNTTQLTEKEVSSISKYIQKPEYQYWSYSSIYYQILRDQTAAFGKTSFYKYVKQLSIQKRFAFKKKVLKGIRAEAPKEILHMDVTIFRCIDNARIYIYFLVDNYSRYILNWKASLKYSANISFKNITEAYHEHDLNLMPPFISLITDGGSENKGEVDTFVQRPTSNMKKLVAQSDIIFSNSMVEAVNKRIKYDYLFTRDILDIADAQKFLDWAVLNYNNKPHTALFGLTPHEVFNGIVPDKDIFKQDIQLAAKNRREINIEQDCLRCFP